MSSYLNITPSELQILQEFRKRTSDVLQPKHDDAFLLRWLRARNFKLSDAEDMLRKNLEVRKKYKLDNMAQNFTTTEVLKKYWPFGLIGFDRNDNPLWFFRFGNLDMKGLIYSAKKWDIVMYFAYIMEISEAKMEEQTRKFGRLIERHSFLVDIDNFHLQQITWGPALDLLSTLICFYEDNYPERLNKVIMINAPAIFRFAFTLLKPFLSETTSKKIHIMGREDWKETALELIDPSNIPAYLGGTKTDPNGDINCTALVPIGGTIPTTFYLKESPELSNENNVKIFKVRRRSAETIEILIPENGSVLQWEFKTENSDIGFGLFYKDQDKSECNLKEIIPVVRCNCHLVPETGSLICKETGTYVLKFDNCFSYFISKTIRCRIDVTSMTSTK